MGETGERASAAFEAARSHVARGAYGAAVAMLEAELARAPAAGEVRLELVRTLLRMGQPKRAAVVAGAVRDEQLASVDPMPAREPAVALQRGVALRLGMERAWISFLQTFDVAGAVAAADGLWQAADLTAISPVEIADADRVRQRLIRAASIYREVPAFRRAEARATAAAAADTLEAHGWMAEAFATRIMLAGWNREEGGDTTAYLALADSMRRMERPEMTAEALVGEAQARLKAHAPEAEVRAPLEEAEALYRSAGHELGLLDVAAAEANLRIDRTRAPLAELERVCQEYERLEVYGRALSILADLSSAAHHAGDLQAAIAYRRRSAELALEAGLGLDEANGQLALVDLLMRMRRLPEAIDVCMAALAPPRPRVMRANFEQFLATCYGFAGERQRADAHLNRALAEYEAIGADDFASITVTKSIGDAMTSTDAALLRDRLELASDWAQRDAARGDYDAASGKHQMRAFMALQLARIAPSMNAGERHLALARPALADAAGSAERLRGKARDRQLGNIAQLRGQIATWRNDLQGAEAGYNEAVGHFETAGLAMEAANCRYIIGVIRLNASGDAVRAGNGQTAIAHFGVAEESLKAARSYYETNGMRSETAKALRMLAQLYANGRAMAPAALADQMRSVALENLAQAEAALDAMRSEFAPGSVLEARQGKATIVAESVAVYDLARILLSERESDTDGLWTWHQKGRARALADAFALARRQLPRLAGVLASRPELAALLGDEQQILDELPGASGAARATLRTELARLRAEMALHPELAEHLEIRTGGVPAVAAVRAALDVHGRHRRVALVDWVVAGRRLGVMVTTSAGVEPVRWLDLGLDEVAGALSAPPWTERRRLREDLGAEGAALRRFDRLIAPLAELSQPEDHLVLCPSGVLAALPLHALLIDGEPLIVRNLVSYAPSAAVLRILLARRVDGASRQSYVIADPSSARIPTSNDSSRQNREIGLGIGAKLGVTPIVGPDADRTAGLAALRGGAIFHYQGHAQFNGREPLSSGLLLAGADVITAGDIIAIEGGIDARLVTLGACESAAILMAAGDEPMGLATALLVAGVHSVCAALWPVAAGDAKIFMQHFYDHLLAAPEKCLATALREAVKTMRQRGGDAATPLAWAPWVLHGDWSIG